MAAEKIKHTRRSLTAVEKARVEEARRLVAGEEQEIRQKAREYKSAYLAGRATLQEALQLLKAERERLGLSLADVSERMGVERPNLSRLENEPDANPTVATLTRYADALGKRLTIVLTDMASS
jgi:DNA-binding XRE family transcriptional regulator